MAYLCPVCEEPQVDAEHLANHLAFTGVIRGGDHEAWLDDHVPGWGDQDEATLADRLRESEAIESVEHPIDEIDGDTQHAREHGAHGHGRGSDPLVDGSAVDADAGDLDEAAREIVEEARELTREMTESEGETE